MTGIDGLKRVDRERAWIATLLNIGFGWFLKCRNRKEEAGRRRVAREKGRGA